MHKMVICGATTTPMLVILLALICFVHAKDDANQLSITTQDCTLTEPVYGYKFDFSGLRSDLAHVVESEKDDIIEFNVCRNLSHTCSGESNVAACLKSKGKEYVLGRQHELNYRNGKMYFNYLSGAKCENGTDKNTLYELHVTLNCDYTEDANPLHVTSYADNACAIYVTYRTPLACLPIPDAMQSNRCSVLSPAGATFDLMSLSDTNFWTTDRQGTFFIINICKPVLYGENTMCPAGSSICKYSSKTTDLKKRFINFGNVQSKPVIKDGQLLLRHESSTPCAENAKVNYTTTINFYCDRTVKNTHPEFMGRDQDCNYQFSFSTPLACTISKPCTGITTGNQLLDLSSLSQDNPRKLTKDGKKYTIAVCASAKEPSMPNLGAFYEKNGQTYSLGNFNTNLHFNQSGSAYLLYEDGTQCETDNTRKWSTKIEFVYALNASKGNGVISIIEDSNCQLLIQYQTSHAYQHKIKCKAKTFVQQSVDDSYINSVELLDLTPLMNSKRNYEADIKLLDSSAQQLPKNTKFFLNVCRPLVPKYQLGCAGGTGVCMAKVTADGAPEEEQSLGFPSVPLTAINSTVAELLYLKGDPCPTDRAMSLSSRIRFSCNMRSGRGKPVLRSIDDCNYHFDWETSVICPPHECTFSTDTCEIVQDDPTMRFNFKNASFTQDGTVEIEYNKRKVQLNICGEYPRVRTDYSQYLVNLFFIHDLPGCGNEGKINVQMRLICSYKTENISTITIDTQCRLLYEQRTPSICKFLGLNVPLQDDDDDDDDDDGSTTTTTTTPRTTSGTSFSSSTTTTTTTTATTTIIGSTGKPAEAATTAVTIQPAAVIIRPTASVGTIMGIILSVTFFVACVGMFAFSPARRQRVRRLFRGSSSAVRYSRVQSNEEANLLLEPNGEFTESDDDMLL